MRREKEPLFWRLFPVMFGITLATIFGLAFLAMISSVFLNLECYRSGDPNSIACFMIADKHEIGVRQR